MADVTVVITEQNTVTVTPSADVDVDVSFVMSYPLGKESFQIQKFTGNGILTKFDFTYEARQNSIQIFLNGVLQEETESYTIATDRKSITFVEVPKTGWKIEARYVVN